MPATTNYDPSAWFEMYRSAFAPIMHLHEESLNAMDRLMRLQYETVGDYLESSLAHAHALLEAKSPADLLKRESELAAQLSEKIRDRTEKFVDLTTETQDSVSQIATEGTSKSLELSKRATSDAQSASRAAEAKSTEAARRHS